MRPRPNARRPAPPPGTALALTLLAAAAGAAAPARAEAGPEQPREPWLGSSGLTGVSGLPGPQARPERLATPEELWARGERRAAIAALEAELAAGGATPERRALLTRWLLTVHAYEAALAVAEGAAPTLDDLRGEALYALTRYDEALRFLDPERPEHALLRVDANEALGRLDEAERTLAAARRVLGEDDPRLAGFEGRALARAGDHGAAVERFRAALAADPLDQAALFGLGRSLLAQGLRDEGLAALEEHRRRVPLIDALEFARQSLDLDPLHAPNLAAVGDAERDLGRPDAALALYLRALELCGAEALAPIALRTGRLLEEDLGRPSEALEVLAAAFGRVRDVRLAVRAGDVARRSGDAADARRWYGLGLELRPEDPAILERLRAVSAEGGR